MSGFLQDAGALFARGIGWAGLWGDGLAYALSDVAKTGRWLIVVDGSDVARRLVDGLKFFHPNPGRIWLYPANDVRPYDGFSPHPDIPVGRLRVLHAIDQDAPLVVVATANALLQRIPDAQTRHHGTKTIRRGDIVDRDQFLRFLLENGYLATGRVDVPNTYAVRGDVVDVWPAGNPLPVRIDFFDDEVEDLRKLDPAIQRAGNRLDSVTVLMAREERIDDAALDRLSGELGRLVTDQGRGLTLRRRITEDLRAKIRFAGIEALLPALSETIAPLEAFAGFRTVLVQPDDVALAVADFEKAARERWLGLDDDERPLVPPDERYVPAKLLLEQLATAHRVTDLPSAGKSIDLGARSVDGFTVRNAELEPVVDKLRGLARDGSRVAIVVDDARRSEPLVEMLGNHGLKPPLYARHTDIPAGTVGLLIGQLRRGFIASGSGLAFIPADTLFGARRDTRTKEASHAFFDHAVSHIAELKEGDYIVHRKHGVGIYRGLQRVPIQVDLARTSNAPRQVATGIAVVEQDCVKLEYRDGDFLLLPVTRLEQISRYVAAHEGASPKLDKLGGTTWDAKRSKVRDTILHMATDLLGVFAKRELAIRPTYRPPGAAYRMFEARFPYEETPDQLAAIEAIGVDLMEDSPMDRLICGDVGYGKTEVAMRATMRAVESGRQVAVLCPTTVLAFQHVRTFRERFEGLPVRIEMLSRFTSASEEKAILAGLRGGQVDVVIGTTRLLGRQLKFANLGMLVIDEEHRFGVTQKERFKKLRSEVDVLAMSATPIPRTLQMGLSGLRSMSIMATPPRDRLSVRTSIATYDQTHVHTAIQHELERGGQVFFVHNRVEDIHEVAKQVATWAPEARILVAHGQMKDDDLEETLIQFMNKEADVLVASAIIESGIDLPNVNTMLVNRADRFGLAQLYQLRGRVGRGSARAQCILLLPENVSNDAKRRVRTIVEQADLGAGFRVAMADLEMRGAGNLLGDSQSGNIDQVGYETWLELLEEAVQEARGELDAKRIDPEVEVPVKAFLPDKMFPDVNERLGRYRNLASAATEFQIDRWIGDLEAEFGDLPPEVENLAEMTRTKLSCRRWAISRCSWLKIRVLLELHPKTKLSAEKIKELCVGSPKRWALIEKDGTRWLEVKFLPQEAEKPFRFLRWMFAQFDK